MEDLIIIDDYTFKYNDKIITLEEKEYSKIEYFYNLVCVIRENGINAENYKEILFNQTEKKYPTIIE